MKALAFQFTRYIIVGFAGSALYALCFAILYETALAGAAADLSKKGAAYLAANAFAFAVSSIFVFIQNRSWVFGDKSPLIGRQLVLFYLIALIAWAVSAPLGAWLVTSLSWNEYFALIVTIGVSVIINFAGRRNFVFRR